MNLSSGGDRVNRATGESVAANAHSTIRAINITQEVLSKEFMRTYLQRSFFHFMNRELILIDGYYLEIYGKGQS